MKSNDWSNMTDLRFEDSVIDSNVLTTVLRNFRRLKIIRCTTYSESDEAQFRKACQPNVILLDLAVHDLFPLEQLTILQHPRETINYIGPLKDFGALKILFADIGSLLYGFEHTDDSGSHKFEGIFNSRIEYIHVRASRIEFPAQCLNVVSYATTAKHVVRNPTSHSFKICFRTERG